MRACLIVRSPVRRHFSKLISVTKAMKDVKDHAFSQGHQPKFAAFRKKYRFVNTFTTLTCRLHMEGLKTGPHELFAVFTLPNIIAARRWGKPFFCLCSAMFAMLMLYLFW